MNEVETMRDTEHKAMGQSARFRNHSVWRLFASLVLRRRFWGIAAFLIPLAAAWLAYRGVVHCGFIGLDDDLYVYQNRIVSQGLSLEGLRWALTAVHASTWQPLIWISYMLDVSLWGVNPAAMHRTNLLLHLLNIFLFQSCCLRLFRRPRAAFLAALVFAVHPVHVESVAWIAARKDLLSTPFWWMAILAYTRYVRHSSWRRYAMVAGLLILGLMAKPMLMTLPVILLLLDVWPLRRVRPGVFKDWKQAVLEKWPLLLLVALSFVLSVYAQAAGESLLDMEAVSIMGRVSNAMISLWRYSGKLLWPVGLAVLYPHPGGWPVLVTLAALLGLAGAGVILLCQREKRPWLLWGGLWFVITLVPVIGLIQFGWHSMADRFLYIPATGLYIAMALTVVGWMQEHQRWSRPLSVALTGAVLVLMVRTSDQVLLWQNSTTLFSHAVRVTRDNWMMHNGVGAALSRQGRHDEAAWHFEEAIRIKPDRPKPHFNLGHSRFMQHRWEEAVDAFTRSLALHPNVRAYYNLSAAHVQAGDVAAAEAALRALLELDSRHVPGLMKLAEICRMSGRLEDAQALYRQVLDAEPGNPAARTGLGIVLLEQNEPVEALKILVSVLQDDPSNVEARKAVQNAMHPDLPGAE